LISSVSCLALRNHNNKKNKNPSVLIASTTKDPSVPLISLSTTHLIPLTATTMTTKKKTNYNIGDRVAERPKSHGIFAVRNEVKDRIQQYRSQRYGTVVGINIKPNRNGSKQKFLLIKWDHLKSPTEHAQMRICPIDQLVKLQSEGYGFDIE
jgi:hypothetical protein